MSVTAPTTVEFLRANAGHRDDEQVTVRYTYTAGLFARGAFADVIAYGRSLGVDIEVLRGGGVLVQRGRIVASGRWSAVRRFLEAYGEMESEQLSLSVP